MSTASADGGQGGATRALPIVGSRGVRPSRTSRWRAAVLIGVHVLIAIHVAHWWVAGSTFTPVEPSEAMEFVKHNVVNVGAVFFAVAILSTLILGRWFCGWGCHVVALQDLCRWLLGRAGLRPKPLRSSVLLGVPLLAFLYMFVSPLAYRALGGEPVGAWRVQWVTSDFWASFPPWLPAALTFLVCGFAAVYFLGAKGFCTNACPYGGIFGVADQLAPLRIRVTDACESSGHCTAVCSSNVRVHEEVRDFKMVVDPGCMKCMDCVSVCPNDALYVGWGAPAIAARKAASPVANARTPRETGTIGRTALTLIFAPACLALFAGFDRAYLFRPTDWAVVGAMTLLTWLILGALRAKSRWARPLPLRDEAVLAASFLLFVWTFRGLHGIVAFLFAVGLAAVLSHVALHAVRVALDRDVSMHGLRLKRGRVLRPAGVGFAGACVGLAALSAYAGGEQMRTLSARHVLAEIEALEAMHADEPAEKRTDALIERYRAHLALDPDATHSAARLSAMLMQLRRMEDADAVLKAALQRHPDNAELRTNAGVLAAAQNDIALAIEHLEVAVRANPDLPEARGNLAAMYGSTQRWRDAASQFEQLARLKPYEPDIPARLALCLAEVGEFDQALRWLDRAEQLAGDQAHVRSALANMRTAIEMRRTQQTPGP